MQQSKKSNTLLKRKDDTEIKDLSGISNTAKPKQVRWGRVDDKEAYKILNEYLASINMPLNEFFEDSVLNHLAIINTISFQLKWQRNFDTLYARLLKVFNDSQNFSSRNLKELKKKIRNKVRITSSDYKNILYDFPGMTMDQIKIKVEELL